MNKTFEKALADLEKVVHDLESGDLSLDNSLKRFEDGMKLSRYCEDKLNEAEKRVSLLVEKQNGERERQPFGSKQNS